MNEYLKRNIDGNTNKKDIEIFRRYLRAGLQYLTPRQKQLMKMFYMDSKNGAQIADELGITKQGVSKILNASIKKIKRNITISLHFWESQPK